MNKKLALLNPQTKDELDGMMEKMVDVMKNPFDEMYFWCHNEIDQIEGIVQTIVQRESFEKDLKKVEKKKVNNQADLDNVNAGNKTIRTIFKS